MAHETYEEIRRVNRGRSQTPHTNCSYRSVDWATPHDVTVDIARVKVPLLLPVMQLRVALVLVVLVVMGVVVVCHYWGVVGIETKQIIDHAYLKKKKKK